MFLIPDCSISYFGLNFTSQNSTVKLHLVMVGRLNTHLMAISGPGPLAPVASLKKLISKDVESSCVSFYLYLQSLMGYLIVSKNE